MSAPHSTPNPWPLGIIIVFALFAAATAALVLFSTLHRMDLVSEDYYEREVAFQTQLDRVKRTQSLRGAVTVHFDPVQFSIVVEFPPEHAERHAGGVIHLYRPSEARLDQKIAVNYGEDGRQILRAGSFRAGLWRIRILWTLDDREYFYDQSVLIPDHATS